MNAKKLKEINQKTAYRVLEELYKKDLWDPVVTNRMSELQCINRLNKALDEYFKTESSLVYWGKNTYHEMISDNKEIIPMMQEYNFNKYTDENVMN